jgi:predicted TIM-barrel fold metal-dependent hydrolase
VSVTPVIDCSLHPLVEQLDDLLPFMDEAIGLRVTQSEFRLPHASPHPGVDVEAASVGAGTDPVAVAASLGPEIERAILIPAQAMPTPGWLDHELAAAFVSAVNAYLVDRWLPADERFRLAIALSPHQPRLAVAEIERHDGVAGIAAAAMPLIAVAMGHEHYHPIYAALAERGLPLIVHPGGSEGEVLGAASIGGTGPRTPEETFALLPQVAQANVGSLVFNGVFDLFPDLTVVFAGWGFEWAPTLCWRVDAEWRGLRVAVPWLTRAPSEVIADHVRFVVDGAASALRPGAWDHAALLPEHVLLYGSDAPFNRVGADEWLAAAPDTLRARVAHDNAAALFARA